MKSQLGRIAPELKDIIKYRKEKFGTSFTTEQKNLVRILGDMERKLGLDIKNTIVTKDSIQFKGKGKIWVLR